SNVADFEIRPLRTSGVVDRESKVGPIAERLFAREPRAFEAAFVPAETIGGLAACREAKDPRVREKTDLGVVILEPALAEPADNEARQRHPRQDQRGAP